VQIYTPLHRFNAEQRRREESGRPIDIGSDGWVSGERDYSRQRAHGSRGGSSARAGFTRHLIGAITSRALN
jgi:hypothetical protein